MRRPLLPLVTRLLLLPPLLPLPAFAQQEWNEVAPGREGWSRQAPVPVPAPAPVPAPPPAPAVPVAAPAVPVATPAPAAPVVTTAAPVNPPPCHCGDGQCGCCTGFVMQALGFSPPLRGCLNVTYDPDEFSFRMAVSINGREIYTRTVSGKNPQPVCVRVPRLPQARVCWRLHDVYFIGRNVHACAAASLRWRDFLLWERELSCFRAGADGVALLTVEDGGGLPQLGGGGGGGGGGDDYEEYDDPEDEDDDGGDDDDDDDDDFRLLFLARTDSPPETTSVANATQLTNTSRP